MKFRKLLPVVAIAFILPILSNFATVEAKDSGKGNAGKGNAGNQNAGNENPPGQVKKMEQPGHDDDRYDRGVKRNGPPPWAPAYGYRAKHQYSYWPHSQVYRDDSRGLYFFHRNGEWNFGADLPDSIVISGDAVTLDMDADNPYTWHNHVREVYPGQ